MFQAAIGRKLLHRSIYIFFMSPIIPITLRTSHCVSEVRSNMHQRVPQWHSYWCKGFTCVLPTLSVVLGFQWSFSADMLVLDPGQSYQVSVFNIPKPELHHSSYDIRKNLLVPRELNSEPVFGCSCLFFSELFGIICLFIFVQMFSCCYFVNLYNHSND